jgi:hypothetical protein
MRPVAKNSVVRPLAERTVEFISTENLYRFSALLRGEIRKISGALFQGRRRRHPDNEPKLRHFCLVSAPSKRLDWRNLLTPRDPSLVSGVNGIG